MSSSESRSGEENWQRMVRLLRDPRCTNGRPDILDDAAHMIEILVKHVESAQREACAFEKRTVCSFANRSETGASKDTERLDWLQKGIEYTANGGPNHEASVHVEDDGLEVALIESEGNLRQAIDERMEAYRG